MGKRKKAPEPVVQTDEAFEQAMRAVEAKMLKQGNLIDHNPLLVLLPVPAFSCRHLLQVEGLPLSCVYQVVGQEASYKSTFGMEILRWHRLCGGSGLLSEAETKPTPDMRNAVLNYDLDAVRLMSCQTMNDWQRQATWVTNALRKAVDARTVAPWCHVVDTLTGKVTEQTMKKIDETGFAGQHYPVEAKSIADFMRAHPQKMLGLPFTFVGINHLKLAHREDGSIDHNVPGGYALKFQCAMIMELERVGQIKEYANYSAATVRMQTIKNSYGRDNQRLIVRDKTWLQEDEPGLSRLHGRFEWWEASILLLGKGLGMSKANAERWVPKMREICDIHEKASGAQGTLYWSKRLDVPSSDAMTAHDLGMRLEQSIPVLNDLYNACGIARHTFYAPGIDYIKTLEGYGHVIAQAAAADDYRQKLSQIAKPAQPFMDPSLAQLPQVADSDDDDGDAEFGAGSIEIL